jgi:hypothetical protein
VAGRHAISGTIEEQPGQEMGCGSEFELSSHRILLDLGLYRVEQGSFQNDLMFGRMDLTAMRDLSDIGPVLEKVSQRPLPVSPFPFRLKAGLQSARSASRSSVERRRISRSIAAGSEIRRRWPIKASKLNSGCTDAPIPNEVQSHQCRKIPIDVLGSDVVNYNFCCCFSAKG